MPTLSHFNISDTLFTMGVFLWDKISQCEGEGGAGSDEKALKRGSFLRPLFGPPSELQNERGPS